MESGERVAERKPPRVYGEIAGYCATNDAHHGDPAPDGSSSPARSASPSRTPAPPREVDAVFADAAGIPEWDLLEAKALKEALGDSASKVPVTAPKSMCGRLYAGGAALDVAAALLAMRDGVIPPTINLEQPAEGCELDFVTGSPRKAELATVLVVARGYGGFNSALVLRPAS